MSCKAIITFLGLNILVMHFTDAQKIKLNKVASGFNKPVDISSSGLKNDDRLFITEKDGKIRILKNDGSISSIPFLDIDPRVNSSANERGLLGLCFHPKYIENGYFFVHYTNSNGNSTISRFSVSRDNPDVANETSEKIMLTVNQPFNNHNAGDINFGKDGFLYIGMGDGGNGGDPGNRSQNPKELLGKMLRIDVNTETEKYLIPVDNPYAKKVDTLPEIWAFGLRNPWRFSFDTLLNDMWIADVGQDKWEEVNVVQADSAAINYGWRCYEGKEKFNLSACNQNTKFLQPVHSYENKFDNGCSVTGGYVYRGNENPSFTGKYIYTDFCTGIFWALYKNEAGQWQNEELDDLENNEYATFGMDNNGEMYVAGLANGTVFKISDIPTVSTNETEKTNELSYQIQPNPAIDLLKIKINNDSVISEWFIFSISGQKYEVKIVKNSNKEVVVDISQLPKGLYILQNGANENAGTKFIKM